MFADSMGVCGGVVWEDRVGALDVGQSYHVTVSEYEGVK